MTSYRKLFIDFLAGDAVATSQLIDFVAPRHRHLAQRMSTDMDETRRFTFALHILPESDAWLAAGVSLLATEQSLAADGATAVKEIGKRTNDTVSGSLSALPREWQKATAKAGKKEDCVFQAMQSGHVPFMMGSIESELVREINSALDLKGGK